MSTVQEAQTADKDLLRNIPLFADLSEKDREDLAALLKSRRLGPQQPVFWIGENGDEMFIVQNGQVRLSYPDQAGSDLTLSMLGAGAFFGELSLLDGGPRTATARTTMDTTVLSLDRQGFYAFLEKHPSAAVHMVATLGARQRESVAKLRGIKNINQEMERRETALQKLVDHAARIGSSGTFLVCTLGFMTVWMVVQSVVVWRHPDRNAVFFDDPPTFFWLGSLMTLVSFLLTIFVLNSQRRQAERDHIRADLEYQVNLKAQVDVTELHRKVDRLTEMVAKGKDER